AIEPINALIDDPPMLVSATTPNPTFPQGPGSPGLPSGSLAADPNIPAFVSAVFADTSPYTTQQARLQNNVPDRRRSSAEKFLGVTIKVEILTSAC
ncbi:MAG: hypothetical protein QNJ04_14430, partial [Desulfobacterales bacterium]|nr:hypothetical protein [Desulfobacterales bacterium]